MTGEKGIMQVRVTLMGALKAKSPQGGAVDVPEGATIDDVLAALDIEPQAVQIVMVGGKPQPDRRTTISAGDELTIVPPVGGG